MTRCPSAEVWKRFLDQAPSLNGESVVQAHLLECRHCSFLALEFMRVGNILQTRQPCGLTCRLEVLRSFLRGILGTAGGNQVLQTAARQAEINVAIWPAFIVRLSEVTEELCGAGAAAIVTYIGKLPEHEII